MIPVIRGHRLRGGIPIVCGFIKAEDIVPDGFEIPYRNTREKTGYQRAPQDIRVNRLVADLKRGDVDLPTAVLFNIRDVRENDVLIPFRDEILYLKHRKSNEKIRDMLIGPFYVVDGQHRILALKSLVEEDPVKWSSFCLPFVCMIGATERQEMEQFFIVNSTAKSVRTDLALDLLRQRAETDGRIMERTVARGERWKVDAQELVELLDNKSPVWKGIIRFPNQPKLYTTIASASLVASLKPILESPFIGTLSLGDQVRILDAYWRGIREACREPFDNDPTQYALQKGIGVTVMHAILVHIVEYIRSKGLSVIEADSYRKILEPLFENLSGDSAEGEVVSGADFWRSGPQGAAGSFSSSAGRRVLLAKLRVLLPKVRIE